MKFFGTILFLFLLNLFLASYVVRANLPLKEKLQLGHSPANQHRDQEERNCSLFCDCFCCVVVFLKKDIRIAKAIPSDLQKYYTWPINFIGKEISLPVWHPPKHT